MANGAGGERKSSLGLLLTPDDIAARFQLKRRAVIVGPLRHELPWFRVGNALRLTPEALERYLRERSREAA